MLNYLRDCGLEDKGRIEFYMIFIDENCKVVVLLYVVLVKVLLNGGKFLIMYGFLDNGSWGIIISLDIVERLNIDGFVFLVVVMIVFGR